jgi:tripartite-type tricarboxylate transporter receptor subunit TctC
MSADVGAVLPLVRSGELIALATASARRLPQLPEVPTVAEAGFGTLEAVHAYALFAPAGLPPALLQRLHERVEAALRRPEIAEPLRQAGMVPRIIPPVAFEAELREQERRIEPLARAAVQMGQ